MPRIQGLAEADVSTEIRAVYERVKSKFGMLLEPVSVTANHPEVFKAYIAYETSFGAAERVDIKLKELAYLKVATLIGCRFCIEFGSAQARRVGISEVR